MGVRKARTEFREVIVTFVNGTDPQLVAPIDSFKAAINLVEEIEGVYATKGEFTDLADVTVLATGTSPNKIYAFDLTTTIADAEYQFVFVESKPNALDKV